MATSALPDSERFEEAGNFYLATAATTDYDLSSEKQIDLFKQSIVNAAVGHQPWGGGSESPIEDQWSCFNLPSATALAPLSITSVSATIKLLEDWKKEGEPGYLLKKIEDSSEIMNGRSIARRIRALRQITREDEDGDINPDSLRSFYEFLSLHPKVRYPEISLTPDGDIYVRWKGKDHCLFSIHFLEGSRTRYIVFVPDDKRPSLLNRISGSGSVETLLETIDRAYGVTAWVKE